MKRLIAASPLFMLLAAGQLPSLRAQETVEAAPLPSAIAAAKSVFIGNAGDQSNADCLRAYNVFYRGIARLGAYTLVPDPAQADLVLEIHYEIALGQSVGSNDGGRSVRQFRVVLIDPKTRVVLWSLTENTNYAVFQKIATRTWTN